MSGNPLSRKRQLEDDDNHNNNQSLLSIDNNDSNNNNGVIKETNVTFIISNQDNNNNIIINNNDDDDNNNGYNSSSSSSVENATIGSSITGVNTNNNNNASITGHQPSEVSNDSSSSNESDDAEHEGDIYDDHDMNHDDGNDDIETRDGDCRVQHAMRNGESIHTILELLELYPTDVQHKNMLGDYPLHTALSCLDEDNRQQYDIVTMKLIELFPVATQYGNKEGLYPLHLACVHHISDDIIMKLIDTYPNIVHIPVNDWYALHYACRYNTSQTVLLKLIDMYPAAIQEMSDEGRFPIHYATCTDKPIAILKLLLDKDPLGINRRAIGEFNDNYTPFHLACENGNIEKVQYFIEHCTDLSINVKDISGQTGLHMACNDLLDEMVRMLLSHTDININALDDMNETPLHKTLSYSYGDPVLRLNVLKRLLDHECIDINVKNNDNKTPYDIIQNRLKVLEDGFIMNHDGNIVMTGSEEIEVRCVKQMIHLLNEFPVKKRWNAYCYHVIQFQE